jgi:hypothetical protein
MTTAVEALRKKHRSELSVVINALDLGDKDQFQGMMVAAFRWYGLRAERLAADEDISKSAISKWVSGRATPPHPTRKTVRNWITAQHANNS